MLVDADRAACRSMQQLVWSRGIHADTFTSTREFITAIESISSFMPDCVVLNTQLSEMNGVDVLERLVRSRPNTPVIHVTDACDDPVPQIAAAWEATAFFEKPLDLDRFLEALLEILAVQPARAGCRARGPFTCGAQVPRRRPKTDEALRLHSRRLGLVQPFASRRSSRNTNPSSGPNYVYYQLRFAEHR